MNNKRVKYTLKKKCLRYLRIEHVKRSVKVIDFRNHYREVMRDTNGQRKQQ